MKKRKNKKIVESLISSPLGSISEREVALLSKQIRSNSVVMDRIIETIDLLANKEGCPKDANTLAALRHRLHIAIQENDTFRKVLWRHTQWIQNQLSSDED